MLFKEAMLTNNAHNGMEVFFVRGRIIRIRHALNKSCNLRIQFILQELEAPFVPALSVIARIPVGLATERSFSTGT